MLLILNAYTNYVGNDYCILQKVAEENRLRRREYRRRQEALRKARNMKEEMFRGTRTQFGMAVGASPAEDDPLEQSMKMRGKLGGRVSEGPPPEMAESIGSDMALNSPPHKDSTLEQSHPKDNMKEMMEMAKDQDLQLILEVEELKEIPDWRAHHNCCGAFWKGKLRPTDYNIIISLILFFVLNLAMGLTITAIRDNWSGMSFSIALWGYYFALAPLIRIVATDAKMRCTENVLLSLAYIVIYVYGILFFLGHLDDAKEHRDFIFGYMVVLPMTFSLLTGLYKWRDNRWKFDCFVIFMGVLSLVYFFVGVAIVWWLFSLTAGFVLLIVTILIIYGIISLTCYIKNKYFMPRGLYWTNVAVGLAIILCALIMSIAIDSFSQFVGFSISYGVAVLLIAGLGMDELGTDLWNIEDEPLFFSPWVFPIYQYDAKKDRIKTKNKGALLLYFSLLLVTAWSVICVIWFDPRHIGVGVCALSEMLLVIFTLYLSSFSPLQLKAAWPFIDAKTRKRAWLEAKKSYVTGRNAFSMADLSTFADINAHANEVRAHIKGLMKRPAAPTMEALPDTAPDGLLVHNPMHMMGYNFMLTEEANETYMEEVGLIVHFQLLLVVYSQSVQASERQKLFKFLGSKSTVLLANGIDIQWKMKANDSVRFARIINQVERLPAEKRVLFQKMQEAFALSELSKAELDAEREKKEHAAMLERQERRRQRK